MMNHCVRQAVGPSGLSMQELARWQEFRTMTAVLQSDYLSGYEQHSGRFRCLEVLAERMAAISRLIFQVRRIYSMARPPSGNQRPTR